MEKSIIIAESKTSFYIGNSFKVEERINQVNDFQNANFKILYRYDNLPQNVARVFKKLIWKQLNGHEVNTWRLDPIGFTKIKCVFHKNKETYKIIESVVRIFSQELNNN